MPVGRTVIDRPQQHGSGPRAGQATTPAPTPAATAPLAWLRALATDLGVPIAAVCYGRLLDEPGHI